MWCIDLCLQTSGMLFVASGRCTGAHTSRKEKEEEKKKKLDVTQDTKKKITMEDAGIKH